MLIQTVTLAVTTILSSIWYLEYPHLYSIFDIVSWLEHPL